MRYSYVIYILAAIAVAFLVFSIYRRYKLWHLGKPDDCSKNMGRRIGVFIRTMVVDVLAHRRRAWVARTDLPILPGQRCPRCPWPSDRALPLSNWGLGKKHHSPRVCAAKECDLRLQLGANPRPPQAWLPFDAVHVKAVDAVEGVYQLLNAEKEVFHIAGSMNLRQDLDAQLSTNESACFFVWEEDSMYTKRESELIQQYLQQYGQMPGAGSELDDLYDDMDDLF